MNNNKPKMSQKDREFLADLQKMEDLQKAFTAKDLTDKDYRQFTEDAIKQVAAIADKYTVRSIPISPTTWKPYD